MTCWLRWCVEMKTKCQNPIWRTFGRIQWHVIPEPRITLQGAATWWINCHDFRATCHIAGRSHLTKSMSWSCHIAGCKNSIRHIGNRFSPYFILFLFLMQFRLWRAAAFVSSPIHLCYAVVCLSPECDRQTDRQTDRWFRHETFRDVVTSLTIVNGKSHLLTLKFDLNWSYTIGKLTRSS